MSLQLQNSRKAAAGLRRWFSKTLIAAYVVLGLVLWQTSHVVGGGEMLFKHSAKPQIGSTKLHVDRDASSRKNRPTKEPVAAFFERAKRGMTEQEIRGIVADFEAIGAMSAVGSPDYEKKRNEWYLKTLAEALSLSHEQKCEVWDSLTLRSNRKTLKWESLIPADNIEPPVLLPQQNSSQIPYLGNSYADSWNLCNLTEDQLKLTYKKSLEAKYEERRELEKKSGEVCCHEEHLLIMHDPATGEDMDYPPSSPIELGCTILGSITGGIIDVTNTFPLTPDQKLADHRNDFLAQAKLLHPAQLRMALMMNLGVVYAIKSALDKPRKQ